MSLDSSRTKCLARLRAVAVLALMGSAGAWAQGTTGFPRAQEAINVKRSDLVLPLPGLDRQSPEAWSLTIEHPASRFVRVRFLDIRADGDEDFEVVVLGSGLVRADGYTRAAFTSRAAFWSRDIRGGTARIMVLPKGGRYPERVSFRLGEYIYQAPVAVLESLKNDDKEALTPVAELSGDAALQSAAKVVAKLRRAGYDANLSCSGFMVSVNHLLTNQHCIPTAATCSAVLVSFDWNPAAPDAVEPHRCRKIVAVSEALDFSLVELEWQPGGPAQRGSATLVARDPAPKEGLRIVQYPGLDEPIKVTNDDCGAATVPAASPVSGAHTDFGHNCDTKGGSSGSPVFDGTFSVVGLHHWGFVWHEPGFDRTNRAVRMRAVLNAIEQYLK